MLTESAWLQVHKTCFLGDVMFSYHFVVNTLVSANLITQTAGHFICYTTVFPTDPATLVSAMVQTIAMNVLSLSPVEMTH